MNSEILAISYCFPPFAFPRSIQVARLLRCLNYPIVTLCAEDPLVSVDQSIEPDAQSKLQACIRVRSRCLKWYRQLAVGAKKYHVPLLQLLEPYGMWQDEAEKRIIEYFTRQDKAPDLIMSFAQPWIVHNLGRKLKQKFDRPWIAHFSDPWVDNPYARPKGIALRKELKREAETVENADSLVFTSLETADLVMRKYPDNLSEKVRIIPHSYSDAFDSLSTTTEKSAGGKTIRCIGSFYGRRSPKPFLRGLKLLLENHPRLLDEWRFELIGSGAGRFKSLAIALGLPERLLSFHDKVSYSESLKLMRDATGLVLIDAASEHSVFLPSKLVEYIGAARPIFGVTPLGTSHDLIRRTGGITASPASPTDIYMGLKDFLDKPFDYRVFLDSNLRRQFSSTKVAAEFDTIIASLLKSRQRQCAE